MSSRGKDSCTCAAESAADILKRGMDGNIMKFEIVKTEKGDVLKLHMKGGTRARNIQRIEDAATLLMMTVVGIGTAALVAQFFGILTGVINPM